MNLSYQEGAGDSAFIQCLNGPVKIVTILAWTCRYLQIFKSPMESLSLAILSVDDAGCTADVRVNVMPRLAFTTLQPVFDCQPID